MKTRHTHRYRVWMIAGVVALLIAGAVGLCQIEPSGRQAAGVVQFDVISELNMDWTGYANTVVFARYWVSRDYYVVGVVWNEPHGSGLTNRRTVVVVSDEDGFRIENDLFSDWEPTNTVYSRPLGERGPFRWGGGMYEIAEMRFAEAKALSRRVYASDLGPLNAADEGVTKTLDLDVGAGPDGLERELARVKVQAKGRQIESMELFDERQQLLGKMTYEYERDGISPHLTRLTAHLPQRPEKLAVSGEVVMSPSSGNPQDRYTMRLDSVDHVYRQGGRTCTVAYDDVSVGDDVLRLPVHVEVRAADDERLLRNARLMNFKRMDLDKAAAAKAARAFAGLDGEYPTWSELVSKYIHHRPVLGPPSIDPNDLASVRQLIAKYPVPGPTSGILPSSGAATTPGQDRGRPTMARPRQMDIEPADARLIRQLMVHYRMVDRPDDTSSDFDMQERTVTQTIRKTSEARRLFTSLQQVLSYHRAPVLPEDIPPQLDADDRQLVGQLQEHYEKLSMQEDHDLGGQLRAVQRLLRLDEILEDYDAYERHTLRYLRLLDDADLTAMYMTGGCRNIKTLAEAGQYTRANRLLRQWADKSAAENDPGAIFAFARSDLGGGGNPWLSVHLLERFLGRSGLSALQRYEGLALRAIALDKIDKLLASRGPTEDERRQAQTRWILSTTTRTELSRRTESAVRQAFQAWQSLGPARLAEARPHSTAGASARDLIMTGSSQSTRLQETSAQLDRIIRERTGQTPGPQPRTAR